MYKSYSMELAGRTLTVDIGRVCAQANGAALLKYGETTVLSTATASDKPRDGIDFFPLSVEFEEKMYSVGKIPGGFNKREGKASENSILTARVIDRPMRPLFPKDYRNDVTLNNMVMSVDPECRPELVAMIGAALSTTISDIPFDGPCAMTQMGMKNGEFIVNPSQKDWDEGDLKLTVASTATKVIMIEAGANEIPEAKMIEAIYKCHEVNQTIIAFINKIREEVGKPKHEYTSCAIPEEMFAAMREIVTPEQMEEAVFTDEKQVREENIRQITEKFEEAFAENEEWLALLGEAVYQYQKKTVRKMILKDHKRPDGRAIDQIRPLAAEEFPYAIRAVSETFESNGSTSMASTCASCMSLMAAGVPIKKMVAGISCGLVTGDTDDDYIVLTDIQGLEDFFGDMDFKVTGTHDGITAIQMDIKIHGLTRPIVEEAIARTREARVYIMDEVMSKAIAEPRKEVNEWAPKIEQITIDPNKIGDVVGQKGKTINEIIARTGVKIDITDDGAVSVCGTDKDAIAKAIDMIKIITTDFQEGQIFTGTVVSIKEFGAFIEFAPGKEGMVHISKIAKERINHVEDVLTLGDKVKVVCLGKDKMGRISFSIKDVPAN